MEHDDRFRRATGIEAGLAKSGLSADVALELDGDVGSPTRVRLEAAGGPDERRAIMRRLAVSWNVLRTVPVPELEAILESRPPSFRVYLDDQVGGELAGDDERALERIETLADQVCELCEGEATRADLCLGCRSFVCRTCRGLETVRLPDDHALADHGAGVDAGEAKGGDHAQD